MNDGKDIICKFFFFRNWFIENHEFTTIFFQEPLYRTLFVKLIPSGCESQFFSLYEISDKGSSWIGPIVLAVISQYVSIRYGFLYIIGVLIISTILLQFVNISKNFDTKDDIANDIQI